MSEKKFYENGLQFECQRCSKCCRYDPGYVFLTKNDLENAAQSLKISNDNFLNKYCRKVEFGGFNRISLLERDNYDCIFWENGKCIIYNSRPVQCRTFPFWINYLEEEKDWKALAIDCPGIGRGAVVTKEEIEMKILERQKEKFLIG